MHSHRPERHTINSTYHCERSNPHGTIKILNAGAYLLAEYIEATGEARWQRIIPAEQKNFIERWLREHFPVAGNKLAARA